MIRTPRRIIALTAVAALVPLSLAGCAKDEAKAPAASTGGSVAAKPTLIKDGTLTVCTNSGFKPFEFAGPDGKTTGMDIEIGEMVAKKLGVKAEVVDIGFDQMTSGAAFAAKKCDLAASAITINDKRKAVILFSDPYFESTQALLVKKGAGINDLPDLKGKLLGVQTDTTGKEYAEKNAAANGVMLTFAKDNPDTEVVKEFKTGEQYGIAVEKANTALAGVINDVLKAAKADGSYATMYEKWLGKKPAA